MAFELASLDRLSNLFAVAALAERRPLENQITSTVTGRLACRYALAGLACALLALAFVGGPLFGKDHGLRVAAVLAVAAVGTLLSAWSAGAFLMPRFLGQPRAPVTPIAGGVLVALLALLGGALVGGAGKAIAFYEASAMSSGQAWAQHISSYVWKPLWWVGGLGTLPALLLGILYGRAAARAVSRPAT